MQKIIKPRSPSRQLLETVNFAFMKIFDFFVKKAIFQAFLFLLGDFCQEICPCQVFDFSRNAWHKSPKKRRNTLKMAILTKKSKIFIKAKLTVSKSCLLGPVCFMIFCIFRGGHLQKVKYLKSPSYDFWNFSYAQLHLLSSNSFCWVS